MYIYLENNMKVHMYKNVLSMFKMTIANNFSIFYLLRFFCVVWQTLFVQNYAI